MSGLDGPLVLEYLDGRRWRLVGAFAYEVAPGDVITVPAGFVTDFASIPRAFWAIYPPTGPWGKPAVIHDYLYATKTRPREEADRIFLDAMEEAGVPWLRRRLMYRAVRLFGPRFSVED